MIGQMRIVLVKSWQFIVVVIEDKLLHIWVSVDINRDAVSYILTYSHS